MKSELETTNKWQPIWDDRELKAIRNLVRNRGYTLEISVIDREKSVRILETNLSLYPVQAGDVRIGWALVKNGQSGCIMCDIYEKEE